MQVLGTPQSPPPATAATSAVLGDDDLLCEILVRVAFPTSLVRAAFVCKRWFRLSSDNALLRRFRDLHPPSIIGFYVDTRGTKPPRFVPMPQPPELAAVVRRANFDLGRADFGFVSVDCQNGLLL
uniref:F-box domain-containing protein n=1 Tax=Triticum urartu TaxID=4572 RepID=A0A8R7V926_TRIUA